MFLPAFNGIISAVLNYFDFPWLKKKFRAFSLTLKKFFPDHFLTRGNPESCVLSSATTKRKTVANIKYCFPRFTAVQKRETARIEMRQSQLSKTIQSQQSIILYKVTHN